MSNQRFDEVQVLEPDDSPESIASITGNLGRKHVFARVKPNAEIIEKTNGHYILTHPIFFAPAITGAFFFAYFLFTQNGEVSIADWRFAGMLICVLVGIGQYIYVVTNYAILTNSKLIMVRFGINGRQIETYRLSQITNWNYRRTLPQMILLFFCNLGNLNPDVFGEQVSGILRNVRFAKQIAEVGDTLGSWRRSTLEAKENDEILETRGANVLLIEAIRLLSLIAGQEFSEDSIVERLVANGWKPEMAERLFDRKDLLPGEDPPPLFREQI